jgi:RelA/SpoT family (p)ppGpp synthetase
VLLYKQLREKLDYLEADKVEQIYQAYLVAFKHHFNQKRDSGEKYIVHPLAVAGILADMHIDCQSIVAALLHDVIEDTPATKDEIVTKFGKTIADLVDGVTKLSQIEVTSEDETQSQNFRKMVLAMSHDIRVILIKLADRLHNMRTLFGVAPLKRCRVAKETLNIYAPIANRLGMYKMYVELEDLAFATLYPRRYRILERSLEQIYGTHNETVTLLHQEISQTFEHSHLKDVKILGRTKHLYGVYKKMLNHRTSFASIMDVYAFRIIVESVDDCYGALGVLHSLYKPIPGKFKDYIAIPKYNGYQSLHTVLFGHYGSPIEIQIRTQLMDQIVNSGIAAHWLYKTGNETLTAIHMRAQQWVNKLIEMQQYASTSSEFFENVKVDLFPDKVYVFTPKGKIMEIIRGSTAVDFAYAVHTKIGNTCVAVRVNRRFLPLSTVLLNGQTIAIITSPKAEPNPAWLSFVVTSKARSRIRRFLKSKKKEELITLGKQLLDKAFIDIPFDFHKIHPEVIDTYLKKSDFASRNDLYKYIGLGNHSAILVAYQLINSNEGQNNVISSTKVKPFLIHGDEGIAIIFADCCCPIPGDPIVGYLNVGCGLEIHTEDCSNLVKLHKYPEKCLLVSWAKDVSGSFRVAVDVEIINQLGALAELAQAITKANANINDISSDENNGDHVLVSMHILVKNLTHFERVKRYISNVAMVVGVMRKKSKSK